MKYARPILLGSFLVISGGAFFGMRDNSRLLGMDFTGGKALTLHFDAEQQLSNIKEQIEKIFLAHHLHAQDFQVRELASKNDIRIFLSPRVDLSSAISTDLSNSIELAPYGFEENKNLSAVVHMLAAGGLVLPVQELQNLETRWMSVSGQVSSSMCQQALWGIAFVLVAILLYITLRFQASYAWSATTCVALDLFFTSSALVLLNKCGLPLQIDLNTVAALMTIIGYSLNNTIIVFDRIREQRTVMKRSALNELVLHALNATLGRTLLTSGTTMAVLLPLLFLGRENALFGFTIVLMVGILFGTLSSLCVAPWLLLRCHKKNQPLT